MTIWRLLGFIEAIYVAAMYVIIALGVVGSLTISWVAFAGALLFFVGCAWTHLDLALHILTAEQWHLNNVWHMHINHWMQIVGGTLFAEEVVRNRQRVIVVDMALVKQRLKRMVGKTSKK